MELLDKFKKKILEIKECSVTGEPGDIVRERAGMGRTLLSSEPDVIVRTTHPWGENYLLFRVTVPPVTTDEPTVRDRTDESMLV